MFLFDWIFKFFDRVVSAAGRIADAVKLPQDPAPRAQQQYRSQAERLTVDRMERHKVETVKSWSEHSYSGEATFYLGKNQDGYHWAAHFPWSDPDRLNWNGPYKEQAVAEKHLEVRQEQWDRHEAKVEERLIETFERKTTSNQKTLDVEHER